MNIRDINPNPHNPRKISGERLEKLAQYLEEYGDISGIVYNSNPECQALVSGHQRMQVFRKGKGKPVIIERYDPPQADGTVARGFIELKSGHRYVYREVHWEKEKADAATIIANGQFGEWDSDILANEWEFDMPELREMGVPEFVFGGDGIGEGSNALNSEKQEAQEDDYEIPDEIKTDIAPGDLFEIGPHRLLCGDSTNADDVGRLMNGERADLCFTSPPYNAGKNVRGSFYNNDSDDKTDDEYVGFLRNFTHLALQYSRFCFVNIQILESNKRAVIKYQGDMINYIKDILIWCKSQYPPHINSGTFGTKWEYVIAFSENAKSRGFPCSWQGKYPNVIETENASGNQYADIHKATFPVSFPAWIIEKMDFSESVIDVFAGTGTTMVAAHQLNRRCYGMEIDPKYCQVIVDRMLKIDPTLEIKRNGHAYVKTGN